MNFNKTLLFLLCSIFFMHNSKHNAGVLPCTVINNTVYILIARESEGPAMGMYADFSGESDPGETPQQTALRELHEETRLLFSNVEIILSEVIRHPNKNYYLFLAWVPYIPGEEFLKILDGDLEKDAFEWVPAHDFLNALLNNPHKSSSYYQGMHIRPEFVDDCVHPFTNALIKKFIDNFSLLEW